MLVVKKFGGTSVGNKDRIMNVAKRCIEDYKKGNDVVVVLSAMGKMTDELIAKAKEINPNPSRREMDMLLTTGIINGNGNGFSWSSCCFPKCIPGSNAYNFCIQQCKNQKNRYRPYHE